MNCGDLLIGMGRNSTTLCWKRAIPQLVDTLTHDWDPAKYGYGHGSAGADARCFENSPEEHGRYRAMYLQFMEQCLTEDDGNKGYFSESTLNSILSHGSAKITRIAADDLVYPVKIVNKTFDEVAGLVPESHQTPSTAIPRIKNGNEMSINSDSSSGELKDDNYLYEDACALVNEELNQRQMRWLKDGSKALCWIF